MISFTGFFIIICVLFLGSSLQKASKTVNRINKPIAGLAQSHLTFVKPLKTGKQNSDIQ